MAFDKNALLNQVVEAKLDVTRIPFPKGVYEDGLTIVKVDLNTGESERDGKVQPWAQLLVTVECGDAEVREEMKLADDQPARVTCRAFLDLDDNGGLDIAPNKNIMLGQIRASVGMNNADEEFSLADLKGATPAGIKVKNGVSNDGNPFAEISGWLLPDEDEE